MAILRTFQPLNPAPPSGGPQSNPGKGFSLMEITEIKGSGKPFVTAYGPGSFSFGDRVLSGPVMVTPDTIRGFDQPDLNRLKPENLARLLPFLQTMDIVLVGTGGAASTLPDDVRIWAIDQGLSLDIMDSGAAARTFNVLLAEERRVGAVLFPL